MGLGAVGTDDADGSKLRLSLHRPSVSQEQSVAARLRRQKQEAAGVTTGGFFMSSIFGIGPACLPLPKYGEDDVLLFGAC